MMKNVSLGKEKIIMQDMRLSALTEDIDEVEKIYIERNGEISMMNTRMASTRLGSNFTKATNQFNSFCLIKISNAQYPYKKINVPVTFPLLLQKGSAVCGFYDTSLFSIRSLRVSW